MTVKPFPNQLWTHILTSVDDFVKNNPGPHFAAFDADGTLWNSDVGENFFQYQIDHCSLPALINCDPWEHYKGLKAKHPPTAYLWLAQICQGFPIEEVRHWAKSAVSTFPPAVFENQKKLIHEFVQRGIQVFVVSASVEWAVEAALPLVGLKMENALGVKTKVLDGLVTNIPEGTVTWREGKKTALLEKTNGVAPIFASGNSSGDIHLLEMSKHLRLAIQTQNKNSTHPLLYQDEQQLLKLANEKSWLTHWF